MYVTARTLRLGQDKQHVGRPRNPAGSCRASDSSRTSAPSSQDEAPGDRSGSDLGALDFRMVCALAS
eukprot:3433751-Alexandrium_andersonii.AAC.1